MPPSVKRKRLPDDSEESSQKRTAAPPRHSDNSMNISALRYSAVPMRPTPFQQPTGLITFSHVSVPSSSNPSTRDRQFEFGNASMKRYVHPPPRAKLGYAYDRWIRRPEERTRLDSLLKAFRRAGEQSIVDPKTIGVVTWRGVMTRILTAPYASVDDRDGPWRLNIMRLGETLYIEEHLDSADVHRKNAPDPRQRRNMYYGYAFESYCTTASSILLGANQPTKDYPPGWGGDVDTNEQFCCVVKTKLGNTRMVIGGEVDCVEDGFDGQMDKTVELKTSLRIRHEEDRMRFTQKLLKFYFQSFLLGVPKIVVGFRMPSGDLTTTETFSTLELPRIVRGQRGSWDPSLGLSWGSQFLEWLQVRCCDGGAHPVWRLEFTPGVGVEIRQLDAGEVEEIQRDEGGKRGDRVGILPSWYLKVEGFISSPSSGPSAGTSAPGGTFEGVLPPDDTPPSGNLSGFRETT